MVIFPVLFCFSLLYLELQRSDDDDADSALWVCSSAGAAQRYPPSNQKGGMRKRATPTPFIPFGLLVADLSPLTTSLAPKCSKSQSSLDFTTISSAFFLLISVIERQEAFWSFKNALRLHCLMYPLPFLVWNIFLDAECVPVWCCRFSARGCWSAAVAPGHSASAAERRKPLPAARSCEQRYMVHCGGGNRSTQRASVCCACITGTITCTNCPTSQVVRKYSSNIHAAICSFNYFHLQIIIVEMGGHGLHRV